MDEQAMDELNRKLLAERMREWHPATIRGYKTADDFFNASLKLGELDDIELWEDEIEATVKARWASVQWKV